MSFESEMKKLEKEELEMRERRFNEKLEESLGNFPKIRKD